MNKKAVERLTEYLDSECDDYDLSYDYEWIDDCNWFEVTIKRIDDNMTLNFRYVEKDDVLEIEMGEDCWYQTREYDSSVKYFWMLVSRVLFI